MSTPATSVNPSLAALAQAGTSPWLDQIQRSLIENGELAAPERRGSACAAPPRTRRSSRRRSSARATTTTRSASSPTQGADGREIFRAIAVEDVRRRRRRPAPGRSTSDQDGFVSLEVDPDLAFDTDKTIAQAREYWQRARPPERDDQDPGHARGRPGDRAGDLRGHQRQRHAALRRRGLRARSPRRTSAASSAAHEEGKSLDVHSVASFFVSRVDTEVDKRLEELGRDDLRGLAAVANARAAYQRFQEIFEGERFAKLREAGAHVAAPAVGVDRRQGPALPRHDVRRRARRARTRSTRCRWTRCEATADHGEIRRRAPRSRTRRRRPRASSRGRHRHGGRHRRSCCATASTSSSRRWRSCSRASSPSARRSSRTAPRDLRRRPPDELEAAVEAEVERARDGGRRPAHLGEGPDAVGRRPPTRPSSPTASAG